MENKFTTAPSHLDIPQISQHVPYRDPFISPAAESFSVKELENSGEQESALMNTGGMSSRTLRQAELMKVFFFDHYFDFFDYLSKRKLRLDEMKERLSVQQDDEKLKQWKSYCGRERVLLRKRRTRIRITHFHLLKQIGQGGYGQVFLARKKDTKELVALKKMGKKLIQRLGETNHILTERDILTRSDSPWLIKLMYAFQDMDHVFLAMEYAPGGDFRTLLNKSGVLLEKHARFYFAEMCAAVFELHRLGYIHRDLKPENFLIDHSGHIKLTDFGLSRGSLSSEVMEQLRLKLEQVKTMKPSVKTPNQRYSTYKSLKSTNNTRAFTLVGSPDYMAPEVLAQHEQGYGLAVDYWSLGCILFEMLAGYPPFTGSTTDDVWINVYHWQKVLQRPVYEGVDEEFNLSDDAWDMIKHLIANLEHRFSSPNSVFEHAFLAGKADLKELRTLKGLSPPFVPRLVSPIDTSYFDDFENPDDMSIYNEVKARHNQLDIVQADDSMDTDASMLELKSAFVGFTFKHRESQNFESFPTLI